MSDTRFVDAVIEVSGVQWATQKHVVESVLRARPGVESVAANPVAQTATVRFDPSVTSLVDLQRWVRECGYHCAGRSVPSHTCDPLVMPDRHGVNPSAAREGASPHEAHDHDVAESHMAEHLTDVEVAHEIQHRVFRLGLGRRCPRAPIRVDRGRRA